MTDVLVGPDFVAVTISRPGRWESVLAPILRAVTEEFTSDPGREGLPAERPDTTSGRAGAEPRPHAEARPARRADRAWADLGALRADRPEDLDRLLEAAHDANPARRQVAAALLADAPPDVAATTWAQLLGDSSRIVRRSVVDVVVGAEREALRPLLEQALGDSDAWIRWKALRGLAALGVDASRRTVETRASDPDFRVRLEAARILSNDPVA